MGDHVLRAGRAALSLVPVGGGAASEYFAVAFTPPLRRRQEAFFQQLHDDFVRLRTRIEGLELHLLSEREDFITLLRHAVDIAIRSHREEILAALRAAVLNGALFPDLKDTQTHLFLNYIGDFAPEHLSLLHEIAVEDKRLLPLQERRDPAHATFVKRVLETPLIIPGLARQVIRDLEARGLISTSVGVHTAPSTIAALRLTDAGRAFLGFVQSPLT